MTPLVIALIASALFGVTIFACNWVSGSDLPKRPTPGICWDCGLPHNEATLRCSHCTPQEVTA